MATTGNDLLSKYEEYKKKNKSNTVEKTSEEEKAPSKEQSTGASLLEKYQARNRYNSVDTSEVDGDYIKAFASDADTFLKGLKNKDISFNDAASRVGDLSTRYDIVNAWLYQNKSKLGEETYTNLSNAFNSFKGELDTISISSSEEDYNKRLAGWLVDGDNLSEDKVAQRQAIYTGNADRIAELDSTYGEAMKIVYAINERTRQLKQGYTRAGYGKANVEDIIAKDSVILELTKQLDPYGDVDAIKKELDALKAENRIYEREQGRLDSYFVPETEEFLQNAAFRDYGNPTKQDIEAYAMANGNMEALIAEGAYVLRDGWHDKDGNLIDINYDAQEPVVSDKLGFYLDNLNDTESVHSNYALDFMTQAMIEGRNGSWEELKDEEKNIYYNLLKSEGQEAAYRFLDAMQTTLNKRATQAMVDDVSDAPVLEQIFLNVASIPANIFGGAVAFVDDATNMLQGKDINPYSSAHRMQNFAQAVRQDTANDINAATGNAALPYLGTTFGDVYQALMSGADSLVGSVLGGTGYGILMGMGAASSEAKELYEKGASIGQIAAGGILAGAAEMVFEKVSIDNFIKMGDAKTKVGIIVNALKQGGIEASEETLTEIANTLSDAIVMGTRSDWQGYVDNYISQGYSESQAIVKALFKDVAPNVLNAGIGGFISGGGMGSLGSLGSYGKYMGQVKKHGQSIIKEGGVDTLKALALDMAGVKDSPNAKSIGKLASKVDSKASAKNVGQLSVKVGETVDTQNITDVQNALVEKGLSKSEAKRVATYLTSSETLTEEQQSEVKDNEKIAEVVKELVKNPNSTLNQRKLNVLAARIGVDMKNSKINAQTTKTGNVSLKNDVDVSEKISEGGKTIKVSTGEEITIDKNNAIAKTKIVDGERVVYYNTDHGLVELTDVTYASKEDGLLFEAFSDMNPAFANAAIKNYDGSIPVQTYINGMREGIVLYGMHNFQAVGKDISRNSNLAELSEADQAFALKLGRAYAKSQVKKSDNALKTAIKNAAEKAEADSKASGTAPKKGKVRFESGVAGGKLNRTQRRTVSLAKYLAEAIGIDIVFYDATTATNRNDKDNNGYFDPKDNSIHLDLQNAATDSKTIAFTLSHELVHFIKKWSPAKFKAFADFLMEQYAAHGVSTSTLLANKMAALGTTDADYAYEEMICDACERMLLDSNAVVKLMELRKSDLELFEKIKLHVLELLNKIRDAFKGIDPNTDEGIALQKMEDVIGKLHEMFEDAAVDAAKTYQQAQKNAAELVFGESTVSEGEHDTSVKNQLKDSSKRGNESIAYNEKHNKVNAAVLKVGVDTMIEMAETMMPYLEQEGILPPDIAGKTIFKNGSYGRTGENTTLCVRTLTYEDFKDRVSDELGRPLTVAESLLVSQKIYDIATDPQCIYCYVAADRKAYDEYLGEYHKAMDKYIKAMREGGDAEALYEEYLDGRKDTAAQQKRWAMWKSIANSGKDYISAKDLATRANRDKIIEGKGNLATQVKDAQRYAQSASWAKTVCDYRAYKGDILKLTQTLVDTLNSEYGLRMYSFSDYTPAFIVENMQMIIDASARGLKSLAYTKDTAYAKIFAPTGQAINVSCFAKYDAKTGTYVEDNRQGASWAETKQLRENFRNVGAVMVCTNDAMVEWAMQQDWVDVVIPYHIVKTGTTIANEYAWRNYTAESSDRAGGRTANIYPTEHNNDFATYQKLIEERGITPRFDRFYQRALNGDFTKEQYMKLVNEVRLPASELAAVVPMFDLAEAKKSFGVDEDGNVIEGGFVDKGGYMGGWYRAGVDVNQEVLAVKKDIEDGKSSLDVDYGMNKLLKEKKIDKHGIKKQAKPSKTDPKYLDPRTVTEADVVEMLNDVNKGKYDDGTCIPVRIGTPPMLIYWAKKRRNDVIDDNPIVMNVFKADKVLNRKGVDEQNRPQKLSVNDMLAVIKKMNDPRYIVYQGENGRYVEVIKHVTADGRSVFSVLEIGDYKDSPYMNGYEGDLFNVFVTAYPPKAGKLRELLNNPKNKVIYDKQKDLSQVTSDSTVSSVLNDKPFYEDSIPQEPDSVKRQMKKTSYAPTFYSQMGKVIDDIKMDKVGTASIVNYLKGKGIKNEEIKWSGIEAFLEGKKSVTKTELQEFIAGSQLIIEEEMSDPVTQIDLREGGKTDDYAYILYDKDGNELDRFSYDYAGELESEKTGEAYLDVETLKEELQREYGDGGTRWSQYKLDGGENYRELVFKMPNSSYSNRAMRGHWGQDAEGILVHARIQDMTTTDGNKMLFIEEIQSDWHNEGHNRGYAKTLSLAEQKKVDELRKMRGAIVSQMHEKYQKGDIDGAMKLLEQERKLFLEEQETEGNKDGTPDAPFRDTYHEYVLKRLLRMAAEEGYDSIGWTPSHIQSERWSDEFAEGYRIEYDQDMPSFLKKYGKKWGATVGKTAIAKETVEGRERLLKETELDNVKRDIERAKRELARKYDSYEKAVIQRSIDSMEKTVAALEQELSTSLSVWSMDITDSMKESVLYDGQPMFQKKTTTNRTLLANALESAAQNDIERNKITQYKEKIALIESEQAKLAEVRAKANELRFTKGRTAEETKQMKALDFEANQIANRINTYDRQLLNLESTTALKNVLQREKELARKKAEQKGKEALAAYKEKSANTTRELMNRYQDARKKGIESRSKTEMRHKIKGVVSDLNKLLLDPTKDKHVPIGLQKPVAAALDIINMDTVGAEERIAKYDALIAKEKNPDVIESLKQTRDRIALQGETLSDKLAALKAAYADIKNSDDPLVKNSHNEAIEDLIANTIDKVGKTALRDMSLGQLETVYDMYKAILATVRNANKMFKEGRQETVTENSESVKTEVKEAGGHRDRVLKATKFLKKFGWNMLKPIYAMKLIGSDTFTKLYENVRKGEDTWAVDVNEAKEFFQDKRKKYNYDSWDFKKQYSFEDSEGNSFSLSLEQIMSLYAYSKREQADRHLEVGGFIFDDAIEVTEKNKLGIPMKYEVNDANPYRLRREHLGAVIGILDTDLKDVKGFVDEMQAYLSDVMGAKGNEVSLAMYDIKLYNESHYFPLKTAKYFREFDPEKNGTPKIRNSGFSKKTVPKAGNPIVLSNFMDVWANHVNDMSMYHAFVLPLEDFMRVYNYSSTAGGYDSVQQYIKNAYGAQANTYIETLMNDLNGGARTDPATDLIGKGMSLFKKSAVFASASVVIQQPSAMARALAYIDPKYFVDKPNLTKHKETWAEVKKYAPVAIIKEMGYFDTNMGRSTVDWIRDEKNLMDKIDDLASKAPALADELTWCAIWKAVKREIAATTNLKVGSEEFLVAAGKRFTEVVTKTQVYDSVLSRSALMRSKDTGAKMITAFMAEPTTSLNMVVDAIIEGKRGNKKFAGKVVGAVAASIILNSILVSLVTAARDDDDDETYSEKYLESLTAELLDGFNPLTYVPLVKDMWSIMQGYDIERSDMSIWSDLWQSVENLFSDNKSGFEKTEGIVGSIASIFGLPAKNLMRDARALYSLTTTLLSGTPTTKSGVGEAIGGAIKSSIPLYSRIEKWVGADKSKSDNLYNAIMSGDEAHVKRLKSGYKDETAINTAIRTGLRENDSRIKEAAQARIDGDISKYTRIVQEIIAEGNFVQDIIVGAVNAEINAINSKDDKQDEATDKEDESEKATSIYRGSDINAAFENGENDLAREIIDELIKTKVTNGATKKEAQSAVKSSMTSYWKPLYKAAYKAGNTEEMRRIRLILKASGIYGTTSDILDTCKAWLKDK